jgi:outer membrane murein-binding lipoprotein Lpp
MNCAHKALLVVVVVSTLGLWGCTQGRTGGNGTSKLRDLEARNAKLEEDYRASAADGAELRKKLADVEELIARLTPLAEQLPGVLKERDRLRQEVKITVNERNTLQTRMQEFSRDLQALVGRVDAAAGTPGPSPVTSSTSTLGQPGNL